MERHGDGPALGRSPALNEPDVPAGRYTPAYRVGEEDRLTALLQEHLKVERLLADLGSRFSSLPEDQVDGEIELWMRRLVEMLGADRSSFSELRPEGLVVTHTYAVPGIDPTPRGLANVRLPWLVDQLTAGSNVI